MWNKATISPTFRDKFHIQVLHPGVGQYYMMLWYEYNVGHNIILSRREEDLFTLWQGTYGAKHRNTASPTDVKEIWKITMTNLPPEMTKVWAQGKAEKEMYSIMDSTIWMASMLNKDEQPYPKRIPHPKVPYILPCPKYEPDFELEEGEELSEYDLSSHRSCHNCDHYGWRFDVDIETLWTLNKNRDLERRKKQGKPQSPDPDFSGMVREYDPNKPFYVANSDFGDHSPGVRICDVTSAHLPHLPDKVFFFFQGEKLKIPPIYKKTQDSWKRDRKQKEKADKRAIKQRTENREAETLAGLVYDMQIAHIMRYPDKF